MNSINSTHAPPTTFQGSPAAPEVEAELLSWQLGQAVATSPTLPDLLSHLARIIHDQTDCLALWFSMPDQESGEFSNFHPVPQRQDDPVWGIVEDLTRTLTPKSVQSGLQQSSPFQANSQLVVSPAGEPQPDQNFHPFGVWAGCFSTESQTPVRQNWLMSMIAQATSAWFVSRSVANTEARAKHSNEVLATIVALSKTDQVSQTCMVLSNQLRKLFSAELVAVSLREGTDSYRLVAISDIEQIDHSSMWTTDISKACAAGGLAGSPVAFPNIETQPTPDESIEASTDNTNNFKSSVAHLCHAHGLDACVSLPLTRKDGQVCATVLVVTDQASLQAEGAVEHFAKTTQLIGAHVDIVTRANRGPRQWLSDAFEQWKKTNWARNAMFAMAALTLILCLPLPYRIPCDCTVQPVKRRFLAAPYDGILDHALVKLGDVVSEGDILARMDGGNLRIEMLGVQAELAAAKKRRDSALAQGEVAQSQIARSEMKRYEAKIDLLTERLKNLEIRSPINGIIVAGDLEKAEGAPLEMGQTVFEVAPLDQMLVEVAIEQSEINYARAEMPVDIKLNAFPFRSWEGTVKSIGPSTEIVNDKAVFVAEVEITNQEMTLKPGMEGTAKIRGDRACLGWSLFHRPWESIRYWTVW